MLSAERENRFPFSSLHNILVLVFHSRVGDASVPKLRFKGNYSFIPEGHLLIFFLVSALIKKIKRHNFCSAIFLFIYLFFNAH